MNKKGFTLIELLTVIAVLAIIIIIAVPVVFKIQENIKIRSTRSSALLLYKAISTCTSTEYERDKCSTGPDSILSKYYEGNIDDNEVTVDEKGNLLSFMFNDLKTGYILETTGIKLTKDDILQSEIIKFTDRVEYTQISNTLITAKCNGTTSANKFKIVANTNSGSGKFIDSGEYKNKYKFSINVNGNNLFPLNNIDQTIAWSTTKYFPAVEIDVKPNTNYHMWWESFERNHTNGNIVMYVYNDSTLSSVHGHVYFAANNSDRIYTGSTINSGDYNKLYFVLRNNQAKETKIKIKNLMLEEGASATTYEPYIEPQTYDIYINNPLKKYSNFSDYVDFKNNTVVYYDENGSKTIEKITLPKIITYEGINNIEVVTAETNIVLNK